MPYLDEQPRLAPFQLKNNIARLRINSPPCTRLLYTQTSTAMRTCYRINHNTLTIDLKNIMCITRAKFGKIAYQTIIHHVVTRHQ